MRSGLSTLLDLVEAFNHTPEALSASQHTKRARKRAFGKFLSRFGNKTSIDFLTKQGTRSRLYDWRDSFAATPAEGNMILCNVSMLFNWAVDRGLARDNPAAGLKPLGPKQRSRADKIWLPEQILQLLDAAELPIREIALAALWTGMRESDLFELSADQLQEGWVVFQPGKTRKSTGVIVQIPYHHSPVITPLFVRLGAVQWKAGQPIFRNREGQPWVQQTFSRHWLRSLAKAGLADCGLHFHDLRGTFVTRLLEADCTNAEVSSLTGHVLAGGGSIRNYAARTRAIADNAYQKLVAYAGEKYDDAQREYFSIV